jgi:hypothetical protein
VKVDERCNLLKILCRLNRNDSGGQKNTPHDALLGSGTPLAKKGRVRLVVFLSRDYSAKQKKTPHLTPLPQGERKKKEKPATVTER